MQDNPPFVSDLARRPSVGRLRLSPDRLISARSKSLAEFTHILLTRFNVQLFAGRPRPTDDWLRNRLVLFRRYCVASVVSQSTRQFRWLVFLDEDSPPWFREEMHRLSDEVGIETVYVEGIFASEIVARAVQERADTPYVITTRLDNDDAVAVDFLETIQRQFDHQGHAFIDLLNGAQYASGRFYLRPYPLNPFVSLVEKVTSDLPMTVLVGPHQLLGELGPVVDVRTSHPAWLQIIHGDNVENEIVGLRAAAGSITPHFPGLDVNTRESRAEVILSQLRTGLGIAFRLISRPRRLLALLRTILARTDRT